KIAVKNFDAIYFDSHETKQVFEKQENIKGEVLSFITSKITPKQFSLDIRNINMVYIGRIHKSKNLKDSIRFVKKLNELGVCANFDMYGPDEGELADITSAIESFGLSSKIKYKGVLKYNEVDDVLKNYDVYLQLSLYEGMAMSVVTALQAGLIALVSAVGEIPNYIEDGVNGVLFDISCLDDDIYIEKIASDFQRLINENKLIKMHEIGKVTFANKPLYAEDYINKIIKHT
ncbi:glycosyltransferase family 1 protein, partial [Salmonella enterica subsp. arizonae]|nr:glycosyltransferase family 1 protein [Salmonella enterica subsp. arizonae]